MSALMQRTAVPSGRGDMQMIAALKCETFEFPLTYKVRECKYCRSKSWIATPMAQGTFPTWDPLVPWNQGKRDKPLGSICKICPLVLRLTCLVFPLFCLPNACDLFVVLYIVVVSGVVLQNVKNPIY